MPFVRTTSVLGAALLAACLPDSHPPAELQHYSEGFMELHHAKRRAVDILVVLDNSSSMAEEQALLANNLAPMIEVLESEDLRADYRIAITTTDAGHPSCPSSTPERGAFLLTPCTSRLDEFVADGEGGPSDVRALSCTDICGLSNADLEILPTTTDEDSTPRTRPWLERIAGHSNLREGVEMRDAFACFAPQGVAGCDFETPLESMYQALLRTQDATDPAYGFLRKDAMLLVVIVTDEDDCSVAPGGEASFSADATSAACWNAGVTCVGDPSNYDSCEATNVDLEGHQGVSDADAILRPTSRYVGLIEGIMAEKRVLDPQLRPLIAVVGGSASDGKLHFGDIGDIDPEFQATFGIGPGCVGYPLNADPPPRATPPVRLFATLTALGPPAIDSICDSDWTPVLEVLFPHTFEEGLNRPPCFSYCPLDTDPSTSTLEPDCIVEEETPDGTLLVEECTRDEKGYLIDPETYDFQLPPDVDVCYAQLIDRSLATPDPNDDISPECSDQGMTLELRISRRPGYPAIDGSRVTATCSLSDAPSIDCPDLND